ncbi:hypothetical protein B0H11DRAFT_2106157, partial [Mycena galericulata]
MGQQNSTVTPPTTPQRHSAAARAREREQRLLGSPSHAHHEQRNNPRPTIESFSLSPNRVYQPCYSPVIPPRPHHMTSDQIEAARRRLAELNQPNVFNPQRNPPIRRPPALTAEELEAARLRIAELTRNAAFNPRPYRPFPMPPPQQPEHRAPSPPPEPDPPNQPLPRYYRPVVERNISPISLGRM